MSSTILFVSGGGGFDPLDPSGLGNLMWTIVIFLVALPLMWKMVFSKIAGAPDGPRVALEARGPLSQLREPRRRKLAPRRVDVGALSKGLAEDQQQDHR